MCGKLMSRQILTRFDPDKNLQFYDKKSASVRQARLLAVCFSLEILAGIMRRDCLAKRKMGRDMGAARTRRKTLAFFPTRPYDSVSPSSLHDLNAICVRDD